MNANKTNVDTTAKNIRVRMARAEDYQAVLDINRQVHAGFDYLPSLYFYFLHHPDVYMWVVELEETIVGFSASYCIEKRSVSYNFAARVHPDYQGREIMRHLAQAKIEELKKLLPKGFCTRSVQIKNAKIHLACGRHIDSDIKIAGGHHHMMYTIASTQLGEGLSKMAKPVDGDAPKTFLLGRTIEILQCPDTLAMIKKNSDFITAHAYWLPLRITRANLTKIAKECNIRLSMKGTKKCQAVSFGTWYLNIDSTIRVNLDYFGKGSVDMLVSHIMAHLRDASISATDTEGIAFRVILAFPYNINAKSLEESLIELIGERNMEIESFRCTRTVVSESKYFISKL